MNLLRTPVMLVGILLASAPAFAESAIPAVNQFCLQNDTSGSACFIEELTEGRSTLYATESNYENLLLQEDLVQMNLEFQVLSEETYFSKLNEALGNTIVIRPYRLDILDHQSAPACASAAPGWVERCIIGTAGATIGGAIAGARYGAAGAVIGAIGGFMVGAGNMCIGGFKMYVHFNNVAYDITESAARRHVILRCN